MNATACLLNDLLARRWLGAVLLALMYPVAYCSPVFFVLWVMSALKCRSMWGLVVRGMLTALPLCPSL